MTKLIRHICGLIFLLSTGTVYADATPFKNHLTIEIEFKNPSDTLNDFYVFFFNTRANQIDTISECNNGEYRLFRNKNKFTLSRLIPIDFKVKDKVFVSQSLNKSGSISYIQLQISDKGITDITLPFGVPLKDYLLAFFITLILEILTGLIYFKRKKISSINIWIIALCNLITHPLLWCTCAKIGWYRGLVPGELVVVIFEAIFIWLFLSKHLTLRQCFRLSAYVNIVSLLLGGFLYEVIKS